MSLNLSRKEIEIILTLRDEASRKIKSFRADIKEFNSATKDSLQPILLLRQAWMKASLAFAVTIGAAAKGVQELVKLRNEITDLDIAAMKMGTSTEALSKKLYGFNIATTNARIGTTGALSAGLSAGALGEFVLAKGAEALGSVTRAVAAQDVMLNEIKKKGLLQSFKDGFGIFKKSWQKGGEELQAVGSGLQSRTKDALKKDIELSLKERQLTLSGIAYKKWALEEELNNSRLKGVDSVRRAEYEAAAIKRIEEDRTLAYGNLVAVRLKSEGDALGAMRIEQQNALVEFKRQFGSDGEMVREFVAGQEAMRKEAELNYWGLKNETAIFHDNFVSLIGSMTSTFSNVFYNTITGQIKSLKGVFNDFGQAVLKNLSDMVAQYVMAKAIMGIGNVISGWGTITGGVGGSVISTGPQSMGGHTFTQAWSPYHRGGFVRAHSGLAVDEVPIIAQRGERVLSRRQNRQYEDMVSGRGPERSNVTYNIYAVDAASFVALCMRYPEGIHAAIQDRQRRNITS